MNKKNLVKIINKELTILADIVNDFSGTDEIHPFEIELALQKAKDIYGELLLLKGEQSTISRQVAQALNPTTKAIAVDDKPDVNQTIPEKSESETPVLDEAVIEKMPEVPGSEPEIESNFVPDSSPVPDKVSASDTADSPDPVSDVNKESTESGVTEHAELEFVDKEMLDEEEELPYKIESFTPTKEPVVEVQADTVPDSPKVTEVADAAEKQSKAHNTIVADKFQNQTPSINDRLAGIKQHKDLASSLKDSPVKDLKAAIKLNDRIWFTNELFHKNSELFNKTVEVINQSADLDAALAHIFTHFTWDQNKKSTISFLELVFRRFAK